MISSYFAILLLNVVFFVSYHRSVIYELRHLLVNPLFTVSFLQSKIIRIKTFSLISFSLLFFFQDSSLFLFVRFKHFFSIWIWLLCAWSKCDRKWCKWWMNECDMEIDANEGRNRERKSSWFRNVTSISKWNNFSNGFAYVKLYESPFHSFVLILLSLIKMLCKTKKKGRFKIRHGRKKTKL